MEPVPPVWTAPLLPGLHAHLLALLRSLEPDDWLRPTVAGAWKVRDVVAHLVDTQVRRLSMQRDGHAPAPVHQDLTDYRTLVGYINELNASWVSAMGRVSPPLLVDLLNVVGPQFADFMGSLDPDGEAFFPVAWAGEATSRNWLDVGRDYTELWHHQAQIRMAVGAALLEEREWIHPLLALSVHGLRRSLTPHAPAPGTALALRMTGDAGGAWSLVSSTNGWLVRAGLHPAPDASVTLPAALAWRIFFNMVSVEEARAGATLHGDAALAEAVFRTRSVMV